MDIIVVGGGVIGLTAAAELLARGHAVTIWRREPAMASVSGVAAAIWYPYLADPPDQVLRWSHLTYERLLELTGSIETGVSMVAIVELFAAVAPSPAWLPAAVTAAPVDPSPFGEDVRSAWRVEVPLCEPQDYLPWLERLVVERGGRLEQRAVQSFAEPLANADRVVNCAGLGARELCSDPELVGVRGQVLRTEAGDLPFGVIDDTAPGHPVYVLPRRGDVVLGGTATRSDDATSAPTVDAGDSRQIRAACARRVPATASLETMGTAVGLRPYRSRVRLEIDSDEPRLLHDYGHGGSGFTLAWGCADDVATLLD